LTFCYIQNDLQSVGVKRWGKSVTGKARMASQPRKAWAQAVRIALQELFFGRLPRYLAALNETRSPVAKD